MRAVGRRGRRREDRSGDPLDGLVNLFDLGIVLSVAFLLAALSSLKLTGAVTGQAPPGSVPLPPGATPQPVASPGPPAGGTGVPVGTVYRLQDGRLVYVTSPAPSPR